MDISVAPELEGKLRFAALFGEGIAVKREAPDLWREIETLSHPSGRPLINLYGKAQSKADELGIKKIAASLSHAKEYAVACVSAFSEANQSKKSGN